MNTILVVDDEPNMTKLIEMLFRRDSIRVLTAGSGEEAFRILERHEEIDLVLSDVRLPDIDGVRILQHVRAIGRSTPVVLVTAYGTINLAVEAMKQGAADFVTKPFKKEFMRHIVMRVLNEERGGGTSGRIGDEQYELVIESPAMRSLLAKVHRIGDVSASVLIVGESGVGKEVVARAIHRAGRPDSPFISISCPAIPPSLMESELFGHAKGAFTGAARAYDGRLRQADGGTLMLDEIADLPLDVQPKLLRFLEQRSFEPLGENRTVRVDTRLISATNRDLETLVADGSFREDLFYRVNTITLEVPPLRDRTEDILPLAQRFLAHPTHANEIDHEIELSADAEHLLARHDWPGNVRELKNAIEHACVFCDGKEITADDLPPNLRRPQNRVNASRAVYPRTGDSAADYRARADDLSESAAITNKLHAAEKSMLIDALNRTGWNITAAARELGVSRNVVRYRIEKYDLQRGSRISGTDAGGE